MIELERRDDRARRNLKVALALFGFFAVSAAAVVVYLVRSG